MADLAEEISARLTAAGIDPASFEKYGVPAAEVLSAGNAEHRRRALERFDAFARVVHVHGMNTWNAWHFGIEELARAFAGEIDVMLPLVAELEGLCEALAKTKQDDSALQRLTPSLRASLHRPWIAECVLRTARDIAAGGADPGMALQIAIPAIAQAATGVDPNPPEPWWDPADGPRPEPEPPPPPNRELEEPRFAPVAAALRESFVELDAHGIPPSWPIAQGVAAIARTFAGHPAVMAERLREMTELCLVLQDQEITPHPTIEHGVVVAFQQTGGEHWMRDEVFPLAFAIASSGKEPLLALQRIGFLYGLGPERGPVVVNKLRARAELGLDIGLLLGAMDAILRVAGEDEDRFETLFASLGSLLESMAGAGMNSQQAFDEALPYLFGRTNTAQLHAERILTIARRLVRMGVNPGPPLLHGLFPAFLGVEEAAQDVDNQGVAIDWLRVLETIMASTEALLDANIDPWRFLSPGVFAALRVAGRNPVAVNEVIEELRTLAIELERAGVDPGPLLHGFHNLGIELAGQREVFSTTLTSLREFAPALKARGIDPERSTRDGLAKAAALAHETGAGWLVPGAASLGRRLADEGIEPARLLARGLPALVKSAGSSRDVLEPLFDEMVRCAAACKARDLAVPLDEVIESAAGELDAGSSVRDAMRLVRESAGRGLDASAFAAVVVPVIAASESRGALLEALAVEVGNIPAGAGPAYADAAAAAAQVAKGDAAAFASALAVVRDAWVIAGGSAEESDPGALFHSGSHAAAHVAGARAPVWASLMKALAERVAKWRASGMDPRPAIQKGAWQAARAAGDREDAFLGAVDAYVQIGAKRGKAEEDEIGALLVEHIAPLAFIGARRDPRELVAALEEVARLREPLAGVQGMQWLLPWMGRFGELIGRVPSAWRELIVPALREQTAAIGQVMDGISRLDRHVDGDAAVALLKHIVTQEGVRANDILWALLIVGTSNGTIQSLSDEAELLVGFVRDVPVCDPGFYVRYRDIMRDAAKSDAEKRTAIEALGAGVEDLAAAVVAGEVPKSRENDPLLGHVLMHVFPPAVSVGRDRYEWLFKDREDHPDHPLILGGPEKTPPPIAEMKLPRGGYRLRDGATIDHAPFESLRTAVLSVHQATGEEDLEKLGVDLFGAWIDGSIGSARLRGTFLERLYRRHREAGHSLPEKVESAEQMLRYREFLADAAREITQEAFRAARAAGPERYDAQARAKLSPASFVGPGLVRSVWRTIEQARSGAIDAATARTRLARQLKSFDLGNGADDRLLACANREALEALLPSLPAKDAQAELGTEHVRALQDLCGADLAAMQRELFGDGAAPGKLEYRNDAEKDGLVLELEVTKRRAHVCAGFNEGVCTASDQQLWNQPSFLQMIIWGRDDSPSTRPGAKPRRLRRARGGVHLLVVPREGKTAALALPGVNPSLDLLAEAGAVPVLDGLLAHAIALAKRAGFGAVWLPEHGGILSNRGPIQTAILEKKLPVLSIPTTHFSYRPYTYDFASVFVAWDADAAKEKSPPA